VDLGPGHGETGGHLVFQGSFRGLLKCAASLTGQYLSGRRQIDTPFALSPYAPGPGRASDGALVVAHARRHNLQDLTVEIPLGRLVCVTGVSGSGKTTLVREVLLPALEGRLKAPTGRSGRTELPDESEDAETEAGDTGQPGSAANLTGWERLGQVVLVDQSLLGRTPRSNPVVYLGAFDHIRDLFAQSEPAKQRGLSASAFSFNSPQGQCERCRGAGFEKIEMQFLSDVFIQCPDCGGRRYRAHILEVKVQAPAARPGRRRAGGRAAAASPALSIADFLATTVDEALELLARFTDSKPARRAADALRLLQEAGLGYLRLGQPINTLSGGESQRLKLASHLAAAQLAPAQGVDRRPTLFLFDEPTTGLHCEDVRLLLNVFERLVKTGHSVLVIEHNLDVIRCADWVIDLGPGAGDEGGRLVIAGTPRQVAACSASQTGAALCADAAVRSGTSDTGAAVSALRKFVVRQPAPTSH
jgi:excinuclease ABC subunit A